MKKDSQGDWEAIASNKPDAQRQMRRKQREIRTSGRGRRGGDSGRPARDAEGDGPAAVGDQHEVPRETGRR
jgi:hypothetical protein